MYAPPLGDSWSLFVILRAVLSAAVGLVALVGTYANVMRDDPNVAEPFPWPWKKRLDPTMLLLALIMAGIVGYCTFRLLGGGEDVALLG